MLIDRYLPALRRHALLGPIASAATIALAVAVKVAVPDFPPFLTLFPAVLLCALLGGKRIGRIGLAICILTGAFFAFHQSYGPPDGWRFVSVIGFGLAAWLMVFIIELLDTAIHRLQAERRKLDIALKAADAAIWELRPDHTIYWDENFYRLVGLDPSKPVPSAEEFLSMVHPDDRAAMAEARDRMEKGLEPKPLEEYRFRKFDGSVVWLENRRVGGSSGDYLYIGITHDVTSRKQQEEQIRFLLRELAHRVKNQLAVIGKIAIETRRQTDTPDDFAGLLGSRLQSLAKSHDLLVMGKEVGADLASLVTSQLEAFGLVHRVTLVGDPITVSPTATQYLAMAFHELATNAIKYGALSTARGHVRVCWSGGKPDQEFVLTWQEEGGPASGGAVEPGFGSTVLLRLAPGALDGKSALDFTPLGIRWTLTAPMQSLLPNS